MKYTKDPSCLATTVAANGYAFFQEESPLGSAMEAILKIGQLDVVEGLDPIQRLVPRDSSLAPPNTYSGNFGRSAFPLHTDLAHWAVPPRYIALRCALGTENVATRLVDGHLLQKEIGVAKLRMALVQPRRPLRYGKQLLRILERIESSHSFRQRWDSLYLKPANSSSGEVFLRVQELLLRMEPVEIVLKYPGDTLVIDNWRFLHGRSATTAQDASRHIDRAYLRSIA